MNIWIKWKKTPKQTRNSVFLLGGFLFALPLVFIQVDEQRPLVGKNLAVVLLVAFCWITETLPIFVTALLPIVLYPLLGILTADEVASAFYNDTQFLFLGSFFTALAMEKWNLHSRIALGLLIKVGNHPKRLLLGFMSVTAFLSCWMSNTATTTIMVPLVLSILERLKESQKDLNQNLLENESNNNPNNNSSSDSSKDESDLEILQIDTENNSSIQKNEYYYTEKFSKGVLISVAYSANIGGTTTLIGTGPNLAFLSQFSTLFPNGPQITFAKWIAFALPLNIIFIILVWIFFCFKFSKDSNKINFDVQHFQDLYQELGPISRAEKIILCTGWGDYIEGAKDGTVSILIAISMFIINGEKDKPLLLWEWSKEIPWGIMLLLGGGYAVAKGVIASKTTEWLSEQLTPLGVLPRFLLVLVLCIVITFTTEVTSNTSTANVALPVLAAISLSISENPLLLMIPGTISTSYAFMLPSATPPNAIAFSSGLLRTKDMYKPGFFVNILGVILVSCWTFIFGPLIWNIELYNSPSWATLQK